MTPTPRARPLTLAMYEQVFFRAGVLGQMEELRDDRLSKIVSWLQAYIRGYLSRKEYKKLQEQRWDTLKFHIDTDVSLNLERHQFILNFIHKGWLSKLSSATCASTCNSAPGPGGNCGRRSSPSSTSPASRMSSR